MRYSCQKNSYLFNKWSFSCIIYHFKWSKQVSFWIKNSTFLWRRWTCDFENTNKFVIKSDVQFKSAYLQIIFRLNFIPNYMNQINWLSRSKHPHLGKVMQLSWNIFTVNWESCSDGSGSKDFDPGWVSHLWFGFGKFPLKKSNFSIFSPQAKKISLDWIKKYPG